MGNEEKDKIRKELEAYKGMWEQLKKNIVDLRFNEYLLQEIKNLEEVYLGGREDE